MAQNETWLNHDLMQAVKVQYLDGNLFSQDNAGNLIGVNLTRDGVAYSGGGSVSANVIRADGATVAVSGALSGDKATVVLPQAAYAVPGVLSVIIKLTANSEIATIGAVVANVYRSSTDSAIDPGTIIPSIQDLIDEIDAAVASIPADYSSLWASLAPAFSESTAYEIGQYVTYDGGVYKYISNHVAGSWLPAEAIKVNICGELITSLARQGIPSGGSSGQTIRKRSSTDFDVEWSDIGLPTDKQTADAVTAWLNAHPEATTTVQDHSITSKKLSGKIPFYNVQDYGVLPNNGDVYSELYDLIANYVYYTGGIILFPSGVYTISYTIFIPEGTMVLGEGESSEIYFDETDTTFGTALANAGSNVTIKNIKVSQKSTVPITAGAHPGCIGFSNISKDVAIAGKYTRNFTRAEAHDLTAEDVYFSGTYPIQTENTSDDDITNVTYRNLRAPYGCVSVASHKTIKNIIIENIDCDLFRLSIDGSTSVLQNVNVKNIDCGKFLIVNPHDDGDINVSNMRQRGTRYSTYGTTLTSAAINGNVSFGHCIFNTTQTETNGFDLFGGIRKYNNCIFNAADRFMIRNSAISDTDNYEIVNYCTFNGSGTTNHIILGYGQGNTYNATNINNCLWGDMFKTLPGAKYAGLDSASSSFTNKVRINKNRLFLYVFAVISSTYNFLTLPNITKAMPLGTDSYQVTLFDQQNIATTQVTAYATMENGVMSVTMPGPSGSSGYNRVLIMTEMQLTREPTISEFMGLILG